MNTCDNFFKKLSVQLHKVLQKVYSYLLINLFFFLLIFTFHFYYHQILIAMNYTIE